MQPSSPHSARELPTPSPVDRSGCRAGCTAAASSRRSPSWSSATAPAWRRSWSATVPTVPPEETTGRGGRHGDRQPPGARRRRGHRPDDHAADRAGRRPRRSSCGDPTLNAGLPTLLDQAAGRRGGTPRRARWELAAATLRGFRSTLDAAGFTEIHTPKLVASATESGANVFEVDYFGRPAYLAQSPQFYKQQMVGVFERVYEVGPVFRAEPHDTVRHLAEYVSLDAELGFIEDHRDVIGGAARRGRRHGRGDPRARRDRPSSWPASTCRWCRTRSRCIHFREALEIAGAPADEPDLAPGARARARRVGAGRARQRLRGRRGLPDGEAAVLHPPAARRPPLVEQLRPALPRAGAGHRRAAPAPAVGLRRGDPRAAARTRRRTRRTSRRSGTACRRTAASRSGWSAGRAGSRAAPTCARSRSSRGT